MILSRLCLGFCKRINCGTLLQFNALLQSHILWLGGVVDFWSIFKHLHSWKNKYSYMYIHPMRLQKNFEIGIQISIIAVKQELYAWCYYQLRKWTQPHGDHLDIVTVTLYKWRLVDCEKSSTFSVTYHDVTYVTKLIMAVLKFRFSGDSCTMFHHW